MASQISSDLPPYVLENCVWQRTALSNIVHKLYPLTLFSTTLQFYPAPTVLSRFIPAALHLSPRHKKAYYSLYALLLHALVASATNVDQGLFLQSRTIYEMPDKRARSAFFPSYFF